MGDNEGQFQQDPSDLYAKVNKKRGRREGSEVYATVQKVISKQFTNRAFQGAAPSHERAVLINFPDQFKAESNNRGETNDDGLTYADLDLAPPTLIDGMSVIHSREEPVVYEEIDFSLTPGPQMPDKIWEVEEEEWEERRRQNFWE
ncbi:uncharacterized protein LOC125381468 isoform X1 [Haliotis rufescens]|uniref:uncharacterized protein LOC124123013 isoform X1 n=1 Tax=Haliotis rufescens TaxID=6454 RepID=UPI00201EAD72|nr:uncharacterized protein LOC124123013 isoform X1 [Haliotis rufescens]XP_048253983.1 uncharacterized protein LOC125381468 isoform X1 [Haliotis rufescens]